MKKYPLTVLVALGLFFVGCEAAMRQQPTDFQPLATQSEIDTSYHDTLDYARSESWTDAEVEAYWKKRGY